MGAAFGGHLEVMQWLRGTPLFTSAQYGHEAVVRALIKVGVDVNQLKENGMTPLHVAAVNGRETVARVLIEAGVEVNETEIRGTTALFIAAQHRYPAIVKMLRDAGAVLDVTLDVTKET